MCSEHLESTLHENEKEKKKDIKNFSHQLIGERERERSVVIRGSIIITHTHTHVLFSLLGFASLTCTLPLILFQSCLAVLRVCCAAKELFIVSTPTHTHTHDCGKHFSRTRTLESQWELCSENAGRGGGTLVCNLWMVTQTGFLRSDRQTHTAADLLLWCFFYAAPSLAVLALALHHPLCLHACSPTRLFFFFHQILSLYVIMFKMMNVVQRSNRTNPIRSFSSVTQSL